GLFNRELKKPIPRFPERVGVATATTGAAVRDIINVITRRYPLAEIIIYPTQVQGAGAAQSVVNALEYFNAHNAVDVIIAGRGGGSIEDLWAFNEEIVARAIFASRIPIISAVGHETDFPIADVVADLRAPTPAAAAEIAVPSTAELRTFIAGESTRGANAVMKQIESRKLILKRFKLRTPKERIEDENLRLDNLLRSMEQSFKLKLTASKKSFGELAGKLDALSPLQTLSRGYAIPITEDGSVIRSAKKMKSGDEFTLKFKDGDKECIVK
ncbi:MAG: exodeoxyribonuclease VII large subunit, partial [Oscillospiraceae bacterium]|nr:exodeoxyribonuclease VII large subunit [Oscillospiraceae bacterium]